MNVLKNTSIMIFVGLILGFILPQYGANVKFLLVPLLILMNLFAMKNIDIPNLMEHRKNLIKIIIVAFTIFPVIMILLTFFVSNPDYRGAMYIMAAMPPAVAIIPLTHLLGGKTDITLPAQFFAHIVTLVFTPALIYFFLRETISVYEILKTLVELVIIPFILSRFIKKVKYDFKAETNLILAYTFYVAIAISYNSIITDWFNLIPLFFIIFLSSFVPFGFALWLFRKKEVGMRIVYVLFSMHKNVGLALGFVLLFLPPAAAVVLAINAIIGSFRLWALFHVFPKKS